MGLSRERIRQIEAQAKRKLRRIFAVQKYTSPIQRVAMPAGAMIPIRSMPSAKGPVVRSLTATPLISHDAGVRSAGIRGKARPRLSLVPKTF